MGYEFAKKISKHPEEYGKGSIEGLTAAECANNATTGGDLIPLLTLGVPGDTITAVMLGAFMLVGVRPGPQLFRDYAYEMQVFFIAFLVMQLLTLVFGAIGTPLWIKILNIPKGILMPAVMMLSFLGAYTLTNNVKDAVFALVFGVVGYFMRKYRYPAPPMILGLILGPLAEQNMNRTLMIHHGNWTVIFTRPIAAVLMAISLITIASSVISAVRAKMKERKEAADSAQ